MSLSFNNILVTVDFSIHTEVALEKAIELCEGPNPSICLVEVKRESLLNSFLGKKTRNQRDLPSLAKICIQLLQQSWQNAIVNTWIANDRNIQKQLAFKINSTQPDIVIIGNKNDYFSPRLHDGIDPTHLCFLTKTPVLIAKPMALHEETKTVVLLVEDIAFDKKIELIKAFSKKFRLNIHLVTSVEKEYNSMNGLAHSFIETFDWLKRNLHCSVQYNFLKGTNKCRSLVEYCQHVNADLLMHRASGDIERFFPRNSRTQILNL